MSSKIEFISAGAGSGKTYALTQELNTLLKTEKVRPKAVLATTFTRLAAKELKDRVREALIEIGRIDLCEQIELSLIGTVNSVCGRLLERFAFEAGIPPGQQTLDEGHADNLFRRALDRVLRKDLEAVSKMNNMAKRLSVEDWEREVKTIADRSRANNLGPSDITAFSKPSYKSLLAYFPKPRETFDEAAFKSKIRRAIAGIQANIDDNLDQTKTSQTYCDMLRTTLREYDQGVLPWSKLAGLTKKSAGTKSKEYSNMVGDEACEYASHPMLHDDVRIFTSQLFNFASNALEEYQNLKASQGLVDFVDQEQRLFQVLDNKQVKQALSSDLDLLMVDEFQDTSPIQLAVFMKLAQIAKKVIFVGDVKQSIYGFRGADPALMEAIIRDLDSLGIKERILDKSWRSRPPLVEFVNDIFSKTFEPSLRQEQICLKPAREEILKDPAVETWKLGGKTITKRLPGLINTTAAIVNEKQKVIDKTTQLERPAKYGDIAILCKTHNRLKAVASHFASANLPTKLVLPGLMNTPEATLALACLKFLSDPSDTLAGAEIHTLSTCESPEQWLAERLSFLDSSNSRKRDWNIDKLGIIKRLKAARDRIAFLTPVETLRLAIIESKISETVTKWGPSEERSTLRRKNLGRLTELADDYLAECDLQTEPATVTGLIIYFETMAANEVDYQASGGNENAISLLTHHGAKGLEWPIVILMDLDAKPKARVWGLNVLPNKSGLQIDNPLAGRSLRYWPQIFGANTKGIEVLDNIKLGDEYLNAEKREYLEQQRLLYVSITRARDKLVVALPAKTTPSFPWAETLNVGHFWPGAEETIFDATKYKGVHKFIDEAEIILGKTKKYAPRLNAQEFKTKIIARRQSPSSFTPLEKAIVSENIILGDRIKSSGPYDTTVMGNALHAVIAGHFMGHNSAKEILSQHGMSETISHVDAITSAKRLETFISERYSINNISCEHPISYKNEAGQIISGWIDMLLETQSGFIIIDHKASPRQKSEWENIALSYSGQLQAYAKGLKITHPNITIETWIHFAMTGGIVKVDII